jgi:hypothetical protein
MKAIDLRVREETLELARALVAQRGLDRAALLREALDIGMLIIAASGPPAEDSATEVYGTLTGVRLAQHLRPCGAALLDFLSRYGAAPLTILPAPSPAPAPPLPARNPPRSPSAIPIDNAVNNALDAFGVGTLGGTE